MHTTHILFSLLSGLIIALISFNAYSNNFELTPQVDGSSKELNVTVSIAGNDAEAETGMISVWEKDFTYPGSDYLRLHFSEIKKDADRFEIHISNRQGKKVQVIKSDEFTDSTDIWSDLINGTLIFVEVKAPASATFQFKIDRLVYQAVGSTPLSITLPDEREHIALYNSNALIHKVQNAVAKLSLVKDNIPYVCTGFLLENGRLLTNHHCISEQQVCKNTVAIFGYQYTEQGDLLEGKQIACDSIIEADYNLDYVLLKLKDDPDDSWGRLKWADNLLQDDEAIYIIEHPAGQPKQISIKGCKVGKAIVDGRIPESDFSHHCDTLGGSSGSPIFNMDGQVVGLHHYGFGSGLYWNTNRAVRGPLIKSAIKDIN